MQQSVALRVYLGIYLLRLPHVIIVRSHPIEVPVESLENISELNDFSSKSNLSVSNSTPPNKLTQYESITRNVKPEKLKRVNKSDGQPKLVSQKEITGIAKIDYPAYSEVPKTSFSCQGRPSGYYADEETRCQVFHICYSATSSIKQSFLCPNGTVFSQELTTCEWWAKVDCEKSKQFSYNKRNEDDLQISQSVTKPIVTLPSNLPVPLISTENFNNKTFDGSKNGTMVNKILKLMATNATNHKEEDIRLILDNLFADFQDNKGIKPVKYTEEYLLEKLRNTNLSIHYENQKHLQPINSKMDYSFLLYDNLNKRNKTTTVPLNARNKNSENIYNSNNNSGVLFIDKLIKSSDRDSQNKSGHLDLLKPIASRTFNYYNSTEQNIYNTEQKKDYNSYEEDDFETTTMSHYDDNEGGNYDDNVNNDKYDTNKSKQKSKTEKMQSTVKPILASKVRKPAIDNTVKDNLPQSSISHALNISNNGKSEEFLISKLLEEFHFTNDSTNNYSNKNNITNNKLKTNTTINKNVTLLQKPQNYVESTQQLTTLLKSHYEQLHNVDNKSLSEIENRKVKNFIEDQAYNTLFYHNNNNSSNNLLLDSFNLKESENKNVEITTVTTTITPDEKESNTPRLTHTNTVTRIPSKKYLLDSQELFALNTGNLLMTTPSSMELQYPTTNISFERPNTTENFNTQNNNNNDENYYLIKNNRYQPAISLLDIYNINQLQAQNNYKDSLAQAQMQYDSSTNATTPPLLNFDTQEAVHEPQSTMDTLILPSLAFSFDSEEEVKAFNEAISNGLIGRL